MKSLRVPMVWMSFCLLLAANTAVQAQSLRVRYEDGRPSRTLQLERLQPGSEEWYVEADALCKVLGLERFWKPETRKMVFKIGSSRVQVTVETRLALIDGKELLLYQPVHYRRGHVMLPLDFITRALTPTSKEAFSLDRINLVLNVGAKQSDILSIEYRKSGPDLKVLIHMREDFRYRVQTPSSDLIRVRIFEARLDPVKLAAEAPEPLIRRLRAEDGEEESVLYFELDRRLEQLDTDSDNGDHTIVLTLVPPLAPTPEPEFKLPGHRAFQGDELPDAPTEGCRVLILDPGHGGFDNGVRAAGLVEKEVTLELAKKLQSRLSRRLNIRVELTRRSDRALAADRRAELANKMQGSLAISLHCNAWFDQSASGFEVLFVSPDKMIQSSGMMTQTTPAATQGFLPWDGAQLPFAARSRTLAQLLQHELENNIDIPNRGAKEADIELLKGLAMPAVVLEIGYLSNPEESRRITSSEFANSLADALVRTIETFCNDDETNNDESRFGNRKLRRRE